MSSCKLTENSLIWHSLIVKQFVLKMSLLTSFVVTLVVVVGYVDAMQCWQCAAVDGRKCPDDAKSVSSPGNYFWHWYTTYSGAVILGNFLSLRILTLFNPTWLLIPLYPLVPTPIQQKLCLLTTPFWGSQITDTDRTTPAIFYNDSDCY
jgi:hypothetical protein